LRFPVSSLDRMRDRLAAAAYPHESVHTPMPPFGSAEMLRLLSPEGARLEFFELP